MSNNPEPFSLYPLDRNHEGVRIAVLAVLVIGTIASALFVMPLILAPLPTDVPNVLGAVLGGGVIGLLLAVAAERILWRVWPSKRVLRVDNTGVTLESPNFDPITIRWAEPIAIDSWHFPVRRGRTYVPKGWLMVALRLRQGEDGLIIPFTFVDPNRAQWVPQLVVFEKLVSEKTARSPEEIARLEHQGHLREAEDQRWYVGVEMQPEDFFSLVAEMDARLTYWPGIIQ
ncbi:MAG: hypothetical protein Kow00124_05160 [Anaerolineae bacterium]